MKKKIMTIVAVVALVVSLCVVLVACGNNKLVEVVKQTDLLLELRSKTIDIGIMDRSMAKSYCAAENGQDIMMIEDLIVQEEEYGVAVRKGSKGLMDKINVALVELFNDGSIVRLAKKHGIEGQLLDKMEYTSVWDTLTDADKADYNAIVAEGKIIVGYTIYAPMALSKTEGFDVELPLLAFEKMGIPVEFQEIDWTRKFTELSANTIDVIWNGMTITDEVNQNTECSMSYLSNAQVAVILKINKDKYTKDLNTFKGAYIGAEKGSAGAIAYNAVIKPILDK